MGPVKQWAVGLVALGAVTLVACDDGAAETDGGPRDGGGATDAGATVGGCAPDALEACAYTPVITLEPGASNVRDVRYTDVTGQTRTVEIEVRRPAGATEATPVVIWSHGGSAGRRDATMVGTGWGDAFVRAGYTFVAIAHTPRDRASYEALCVALDHGGCGGSSCTMDSECPANTPCAEGACREWKNLSYDRPYDFRAVLAEITAAAAPGMPLDGQVDLDRVMYAGHSAGAGGTMVIAGATREIDGDVTLEVDPAPIAFLSCSPQGPGEDGFTEASFTGEGCRGLAPDPSLCLTRPHLVLSGVGDDTSDTTSESRRPSFDLAPATGQRHRLDILEEAARHETYNLELESCESYSNRNGLDTARCAMHLEWLRSAGLAFADAYVRGDADARAYLASDNLGVWSGGTWETR